MKIKHNYLSAIAVTIALTGCSVPGGDISIDDSVFTMIEPFELGERINIHQITPALLATQRLPAPVAKTNPALEQLTKSYVYHIGVGDVLNITVWDHPELTIPAGQFRSTDQSGNWVHADGSIFYPYVGKVKVVGMTVQQVRATLAKRLSKYIENPQIDINVAAFRSKHAYVTGEVQQPGVFPISNIPLTLLDAVNHAGGLSANADWRSVTLTQNGSDERIDLYALYKLGDMSQNRLLGANDVIHVSRNDNLKVFVMGEVNTPITAPMGREGMTLAEALSSAKGINERQADASGIFVLRQNGEYLDDIDVYQLNAKNAAAMVMAARFELRPSDVVYVTAEPVARWNRVITQILPALSAAYQVDRINN